METTILPTLSVDIHTFEQLMSGSITLASLSSIPSFGSQIKKIMNTDISSLLPTMDLSKLLPAKQSEDFAVKTSVAYQNQQTRPIETLPKTLEDFKNIFQHFVPPAEITPFVPVSNLESARPLHEETKSPSELTPFEKLLDENFKNMHSTIQLALSAARTARIKFDEKILNGPIHPYQKLIHEYLGPDFKSPSIYDLETPQTFCPVESLSKLNHITDSLFANTLTQFQHITAGIGKIENEQEMELLQGLGHAFAVLSSTSEGDMFVVDRKKTADYLEFAETVRNIPIKEIVNNPVQISQKLISRLCDIFSDEIKLNEIRLEKFKQPFDKMTNLNLNSVNLNAKLLKSLPEVALIQQTTN